MKPSRWLCRGGTVPRLERCGSGLGAQTFLGIREVSRGLRTTAIMLTQTAWLTHSQHRPGRCWPVESVAVADGSPPGQPVWGCAGNPQLGFAAA
jgi:hypothetical protein